MKHQQVKICLVLLFGLAISGLQAQKMYLRKTNGTQTDFALTSIKKITFSSGNLVVSSTTGADASYSLLELWSLNFKDLNLGVDHLKQQPQAILLYPNPVTDVLHLSRTDTSQPLTFLEIISLEGRVLQQKDLNTINQFGPISVTELPQGLYFCKISTATSTQTIKFIKQ